MHHRERSSEGPAVLAVGWVRRAADSAGCSVTTGVARASPAFGAPSLGYRGRDEARTRSV